jgi:hypothetical protein
MLCALTANSKPAFINQMRFAVAALTLLSLAVTAWSRPPREEPKVLERVTPLPVALDKDFEFRKTKLVLLNEKTSLAIPLTKRLQRFRTRRSPSNANTGCSAL